MWIDEEAHELMLHRSRIAKKAAANRRPWAPPPALPFQVEVSPTHFWSVEPVTDLPPELIKKAPSYGQQHKLCLRCTGEPVGMVRRVPPELRTEYYSGPVRTAWISGDEVEAKRHETIQAAKNFLERKFTRTTNKR
jgi:hypothetical protein